MNYLKMIKNKNIVLCVTGSIAAYKSIYLASSLVKEKANVQVIMTQSALEFVGTSSFSGITHNPVITGYYDGKSGLGIDHIDIAKKADLIVVAPATANSIAKIALGISSEPIVGTILATKAPILIAPAMDGDMYHSIQVQNNIKILESLSIKICGPEKGRLASGIEEFGRMIEPDKLLSEIEEVFSKKKDYSNIKAIVTAGGTIEEIDPVRFISNRSSGKMGVAIAEALRDRGAKVTLIHGELSNNSIEGVEKIPVKSAEDMKNEIHKRVDSFDLIIMSAAVGDYKIKNKFHKKIKKEDISHLELEKNPDILKSINGSKIIKVGFAAETENLIENAKIKLSEKDCQLIVANDITLPGSGFGSDDNKATLVHNKGCEDLPLMKKSELAHIILDKTKSFIK
jgi:phosphopantothenoylcysteine decarboxylase/phosphopantothenate--cysteine ligase|tara:strand:- start:10605 stop:11801 length:1197 start_codon:yes stop_codon:yes gene_type:complete